MAIPSDVFFGCSLVVIAVFVLLLQRRYLPLRTTPEYLLVSTFLPLFISSSIIVLVPIDLASASPPEDRTGRHGVVLPSRALLICWRIAYWLCFVLTWAILPLLLSFSDSGHRDPKKRFLQSLRENARYHLIMLSLGTVGLLYFFVVAGLHFSSVKGLVIALSHCYALTLAIYLMGHGLVSIPRTLYHDSSPSRKLRSLQQKAPKVHDKLTDATTTLEEIQAEVAQLRLRKQGSALEYQEWIDELVDVASLPASPITPSSGRRTTVPAIITETYLAALTRRLRLALHRKTRFRQEWEQLVQSASDCQSILDSKTTQRLSFDHHFRSPSALSAYIPLNAYTRFLLHFRLLPYLRLVLTGLLAAASAAIVWTEAVTPFLPKLSILRYTVIPRSVVGLGGQLTSMTWLFYMCISAYYSLTTVKVWGHYALVTRMTSFPSACFYASYAARLTVPLAFNFISLLPQDLVKDSVFYQFLGKLINMTAVSEGFNDYFPVLILIPVCMKLFNIYGRVKDICGFSDPLEDEYDEEGELWGAGWREGRDLIERELLGTGAPNVQRRVVGSYRDDPGRSERREVRGSRGADEVGEEEEEGEQGGVLGDYLHRFRNTIESVEAPRWLKDVPRPRWMQ